MTPIPHEPWRPLVRHPDSSETLAADVSARCAASAPGVFDVAFRVLGDIAGLHIPAPRSGERADGLWRTTCFELFVRAAGEPSYWEVNLSPSSDWAVYRFDEYRTNQRQENDAEALHIDACRLPASFHLTAQIRLRALTNTGRSSLMAGLSAVLEDESGLKSYWALAHSAGAPDFHNPACFVYALNMERSL